MFEIGQIHHDSAGEEVDYAKAMKWYREASIGAAVMPRYSSGTFILMDLGVAKDPVEATR